VAVAGSQTRTAPSSPAEASQAHLERPPPRRPRGCGQWGYDGWRRWPDRFSDRQFCWSSL